MNTIQTYLSQVRPPAPDSHKGQNGKLLIIGGAELFHAASKWSLDVASRLVDMVFYSSVPSNNTLIQQAKKEFWNGIVIPRTEIENYVNEADCILIGPGMTREQGVGKEWIEHPDANFDWETDTYALTNYLLAKYADKKWVVDAGALQLVEPRLLNERVILTPHHQELALLLEHAGVGEKKVAVNAVMTREQGVELSKKLRGATVILKGQQDFVFSANEFLTIEGGNAGMTKGGTGDVLAGLAAGLYCTHDIFTAAAVASYVNKTAGDDLYEKVGPYFNASDLVKQIPETLWRVVQ
jgi:NAD(P)H-hydrate epimerase